MEQDIVEDIKIKTISNKYHFLFGYKYPIYTLHFLQRYAERLYNVDASFYMKWLKCNNKFKEISEKLYLSERYIDDKLIELKKKYGGDLELLKHKRIIFVVRNRSIIVTCYLQDK